MTNGTTLVAEANVGYARSLGTLRGWRVLRAAYVDHARDVDGADRATHSPFATHAGRDADRAGRAAVWPDRQQHARRQRRQRSFFPDAVSEPNDTIFNAVDTRQGRQASPEFFTATTCGSAIPPAFPRIPSGTSTSTSSRWTSATRSRSPSQATSSRQCCGCSTNGAKSSSPTAAVRRKACRGLPSTATRSRSNFTSPIRPPSGPGTTMPEREGPILSRSAGPGNATYSPLSLGGRQSPSASGQLLDRRQRPGAAPVGHRYAAAVRLLRHLGGDGCRRQYPTISYTGSATPARIRR